MLNSEEYNHCNGVYIIICNELLLMIICMLVTSPTSLLVLSTLLLEIIVSMIITTNGSIKHFIVMFYFVQQQWSKKGDVILHIEVRCYCIATGTKTLLQLGKWADLMVIAPLDANTLAKLANGICDNLLVQHLYPVGLLSICILRHALYGHGICLGH